MRWQAVLFGGVFAGLGGAYFTVGSTGSFDNDASAGNGFIALAAVIMGRWHPIWATFAALFFGFMLEPAGSARVRRQDPGRAARRVALPRHDHRGRRLRRPGPPAGRRRRAVHQGLTWASHGRDRLGRALRRAAVEVMRRAYAPYSGFPVGRGGLVDDGRIVVGLQRRERRRTASRCAPSAAWSASCMPPAVGA